MRFAANAETRNRAGQLFLISFLALYFELIIIRWLSSEVRVFAYLKNLPLIACFLGLGLGCASSNSRKDFFGHSAALLPVICLMISFSSYMGITFLPFPIGDYLIVGDVAGGFHFSTLSNKLLALGKFLTVVIVVFSFCTWAFLAIGQKLGQALESLPALQAYTVNIAGSLLGVVVFSAISFAGWPPLLWFALGFGLLLVFIKSRVRVGLFFIATLLVIAWIPWQALWSPYYRIDVSPIHLEEGNPLSPVVGRNLNVNHDYFQRMLDLSEGSPETPFSRKARPYYNLPYRFAKPERVLVVGAGSGNDVAAALRHGTKQVDAVEIDPIIIQLGMEYHPERPYNSPRVRTIVNDARAFFKQNREQYDLIIFGLLDSQTLLSSMSSIRLDNYIYTLESLREAKKHLRQGGTICISFALVETWIQERFYRLLLETFKQEPLCLETPYDAGISYLVGPTANRQFIKGQQDLEAMVINDQIPQKGTPLPTDDWPFLYLRQKSIPFAYWFTLSTLFILSVLAIPKFLSLKQDESLRDMLKGENLFLFLLGAGFMLVEVKSISDLSLLFGSTWIVNCVVIGSILVMILLANLFVLKRNPASMGWVYVGLATSLVISYSLKPDALAGWALHLKFLVGGFVTALPIFFAGILFASVFKNVSNVPMAFGANLLGALLGGILENLCMVYGIAFLNLMALGIYLTSAAILYSHRTNEKMTANA